MPRNYISAVRVGSTAASTSGHPGRENPLNQLVDIHDRIRSHLAHPMTSVGEPRFATVASVTSASSVSHEGRHSSTPEVGAAEDLNIVSAV